MTGQEMAKDLLEALNLLQVAGPNPLLIDSDDYWVRAHKLMDKYFDDEDEDEEDDG